MMLEELIQLLKNIEKTEYQNLDIIRWGSPIMSFGSINNSKIATLGINPSNREFVDSKGIELTENERRFHTLNSLNLKKWKDAKSDDIEKINMLCEEYFFRNPYDGWFKKLDYIISGSSMSYYFPSGQACHLDLIPYATSKKWSDLTKYQKNTLLELCSDFLAKLLKGSEIKVIVLNGQTVVENLSKLSNRSFAKTEMEDWSLNRKTVDNIKGFSYVGYIDKIGNMSLGKKIKILGYNHNIQSSYGISSKIQTSIRNWVTLQINSVLDE